ncbi:RNA polymerase sigma-70 factor [Dictyobacter aurantiacus]|uniref:DNA-directed RNA polymerase sigma-70 factor n=1 Tax=Dictyobacter aurantiacus TaxID=1936993 RepID=A0A401ZKB8_9CHLR|nr:RNA polymerase sigma-70 factor [Dictyobacter aurantiacus]GCE07278.1 DNA-directed RNA polymerase sigma-70 factor [Dictyobacter aurantiacus]
MNILVDAFQEYRPLLFSIAYRMTGSASQAEDIVQDAYLRYQQTDRTAIHSTKSFLTTIVVNLCLNYLKSARVQREEYVGIWLPEPVLTSALLEEAPETKVERQESISLAFLVLLESLTPPERAVFLLHEVFDYSFHEIAEIIEKSPENCRQLFHRAKKHVGEKRHRVSATPESHRQLLNSFIAACQSGDMAALKELLADDVTAWADGGGKVHASLLPVTGRETIAKLFITLMRKLPTDHQLSIEEVNGAPAIITRSAGQLHSILSLELSGDRIVGLRSVLNPDKLAFMQRQWNQQPPSSSS